MATHDSSAAQEIHIGSARVTMAVFCSLLPITGIAFAIWLIVQLATQPGPGPNAGGVIVAIVFIGGLLALSAYAAQVTRRAAHVGVVADQRGVTIHNLTNDLRFAWDEIRAFDSAWDSGGVRGQPSYVGLIILKDGTTHFLRGVQSARIIAPRWRGQIPDPAVDECLERLRGLQAAHSVGHAEPPSATA